VTKTNEKSALATLMRKYQACEKGCPERNPTRAISVAADTETMRPALAPNAQLPMITGNMYSTERVIWSPVTSSATAIAMSNTSVVSTAIEGMRMKFTTRLGTVRYVTVSVPADEEKDAW